MRAQLDFFQKNFFSLEAIRGHFRLDHGIFLATILCQFTKTSVQNLKWPLMASKEKIFFWKKSSCARTVDLQRLDQGIFPAKILCQFTKTSVQNLKWPLMASTEKYFFLAKNPLALALLTSRDFTKAFFWPKYFANSQKHLSKI